MLTIRTSAHVLTNHQRKNYLSTNVSTDAPRAQVGAIRQLRALIAVLDAQSRRCWLESKWRSHVSRVRSTQVKRSHHEW